MKALSPAAITLSSKSKIDPVLHTKADTKQMLIETTRVRTRLLSDPNLQIGENHSNPRGREPLVSLSAVPSPGQHVRQTSINLTSRRVNRLQRLVSATGFEPRILPEL